MNEKPGPQTPDSQTWANAAHAHAVGRLAEDWAWSHLEKSGYRLLARNWRHSRQEIDLIVEDPEGTLVFVEVKGNRTPGSGHPGERVDALKRQRIARVAEKYVRLHDFGHRAMRFDVVTLAPLAHGIGIEHFPNAFLPDARHYHGG